ncbi:MAG: DUF3772 domain-containing protein [Paracoccaceae bacterium]
MRTSWKRFCLIFGLALWMTVPLALAQAPGSGGFDFAAWEKTATRAESIINKAEASSEALETLRATLAGFRSRSQAAQDANTARIETIRSQIKALGPPPGEGQSEAAELARLRGEFEAQLAEAEAPMMAAREAYLRADGMIGEIDLIFRARAADRFLTLDVSPLNPAHWPDALASFADYFSRLWNETSGALASDAQRAMTQQGLPLTLALIVVGLALVFASRRAIAKLVGFVPRSAAQSRNDARAIAISLPRVLLPYAGLWIIIRAIEMSGMTGMRGEALLSGVLWAGFYVAAALWLGRIVFSDGEETPAILAMERPDSARGRNLGLYMGVALGFETLLARISLHAEISDISRIFLTFPVIVISGLLLIGMGKLLNPARNAALGDSAGNAHQQRTYMLISRSLIAIGAAAPLLAAIGYFNAASALIFPAILTLGLIGAALVVYRVLSSLAARLLRVTRVDGEEPERMTLVPVFLGLAIILAAMPLLALIWGARVSDILEVWARFNDGVTLGGRQISISDFLVFAVVFAVGYTLTRLVQSGLRNSVLPRTKLDPGGRNAILTGTGYLGLFLAAVAAITAAGIDLSGIAIVAGALSVGIGFGLQAIVSNFVSGIILLVERPIKEGDWIEVGSYSGTVRKISVRATEIQTFDRATVVVPNADFISGTVINYTHGSLNGRVKVPVGVGYDSDPEEVRAILLDIAQSNPKVDRRHSVGVVFMGFGADSLDFEIRAILKDVNNVLSARSEMNFEILRRFREAGIEIPFKQHDIVLRNVEEIGASIQQAMAPRSSPKPKEKDKGR